MQGPVPSGGREKHWRLHLALLVLLTAGHTLVHYAVLLPGIGARVEGVPFFDQHALHEAEFLAVVAYAGLVFRWRGGLLALLATAMLSVPFALASTIHPLEYRGHGFSSASESVADIGIVLAAGALVVIVTETLWRERDRKADAIAGLAAAKRQLERDVEDRQRAETALQESQQRYRALAESATDAIVSADGAGRIVAWNRGAAMMFGYQEAEVMGQSLTVLMPEPYREAHLAGLQRLQRTGQSNVLGKTLELHGLRKDGTKFPLELSVFGWKVDGQLFYGGIMRDVTERKKAAEAILEASEMLRGVVLASPAAIITVDSSGLVQLWNPAAERTFGWTERETLGRALPIRAPEQGAQLQSMLDAALDGKTWNNVETRQRRKDGNLVDLLLSVAPLYDTRGDISGVVAIIDDITERRLVESQFRQAQKLESVGRLAGSVAHDFNNLLTPILSYAELSMNALGPDHPVYENLQQIERVAKRAGNLAHQLLTFSRPKVLKPELLDLNGLVLEVNKLLQRLIGEDVKVVTALAPSLSKVAADPGQMQQVLMNLSVNSRDAMPHGGTMTIATGNITVAPEDAKAQMGVPPGEYVMLTVSDTGCGMTEEVKAHLFEPFFTTKDQRKGTGLGLATSMAIIKQSGGHLWADSQPGQGTTFTICLPKASAAGAPAAEPEQDPVVARGMETVLLVEDDAAVRRVVGRVLQQQGYVVLEAADAAEALRTAEGYQSHIQLLFTDLVLPGMNGRELAERLRAIRPNIKVLCTSGYAQDALVDLKAWDPEAALLQKPFTAEALARTVRQVLDLPGPTAAVGSQKRTAPAPSPNGRRPPAR